MRRADSCRSSSDHDRHAGSDFNGLNDMLKQVYTKAFDNNIENESELSDVMLEAEGFDVIEGPDGKQVNMDHIFSSGGGVGSMLEDDYLYTPTSPTIKQSSITIKQHVAVVQLSGRTLRRVLKGPAAFATWADEALPRKAKRLAFHMDRQRIGTGTGIICRINQARPPAPPTVSTTCSVSPVWMTAPRTCCSVTIRSAGVRTRTARRSARAT
jgi:hypothetical protein